MEIRAAQLEVRTTFVGGSIGQALSAVLWLLSAPATSWHSRRLGILVVVFGGFFLFPLLQLCLRLLKRPYALGRDNPMGQLAMQTAFMLPICLPVVAAAALARPNWFYPALMIVLGAHYLPFAFLYGMPMFLALGAILISAGLAIGLWLPAAVSLGAWVTAAVLACFALLGGVLNARESRRRS